MHGNVDVHGLARLVGSWSWFVRWDPLATAQVVDLHRLTPIYCWNCDKQKETKRTQVSSSVVMDYDEDE